MALWMTMIRCIGHIVTPSSIYITISHSSLKVERCKNFAYLYKTIPRILRPIRIWNLLIVRHQMVSACQTSTPGYGCGVLASLELLHYAGSSCLSATASYMHLHLLALFYLRHRLPFTASDTTLRELVT